MFPEWMGNGWTLTKFTFGFLIAGHLISYFLQNAKVRFWLTYVAIFMGGAALLTSFHSAFSAINTAKMELASGRLDRAGAEVLREISATQNYMCNFRGTRTSMSPTDFDDIERLRQEICGMFNQIKTYADKWDRKHEAFNPPDVGLTSVKNPVWIQSVEEFQRVSTEHHEALDEVSSLQPQPWLFWTALEPFVISASWSLALALLVPPRKCNRDHGK